MNRNVMPTRRQLQVLDYINDCVRARGYPPTHRQIADHFGWVSANSSQFHVEALRRKGLLAHEPGQHRSTYITAAGHRALG